MLLNPNKTLILAPHPDDAEFGCGGTIAKLLNQGRDVSVMVFSKVNPAINPPETLTVELNESMRRFGVIRTAVKVYDFPMRRLNYVRQDILQELMDVKDEIDPDLVFIPSPNDVHMDHLTISQEGLRAFKGVTTLGYELPWNNFNFKTQVFVELNAADVECKISAIEAYESQAHKKYASPKFIKALAVTRGVQIGFDYAEAFEGIRCVLK